MSRERKSGCFPVVLIAIAAIILIGYASKKVSDNIDPQPAANYGYYVNDGAGVLSETTKKQVYESNKKIEKEYGGAQYVFVIVDSLKGEDIKTFTKSYFKEASVGSLENDNGMLIVVALEEKAYYTTYGNGLDNSLAGKMAVLLYKYFEPDFTVGEYDTAITKSIPYIESAFKNACSKWKNES